MTTTETTTPAPEVASQEDNTVAIVSYLTIIGFIAAIIIHQNKKTKLGAFHLRQALGLGLTGVASGFFLIIPFLGVLIVAVVTFALFVFAVLGFLSALKRESKPLPILGAKYQEWLGTAFD